MDQTHEHAQGTKEPAKEPVKDRVLDAAEAVVIRDGINGLTLEAAAVQAGLSKGGLLHHFPSKDRLIEAMVERCAQHWLSAVHAALGRTPEGPGRTARALLSHLTDTQAWTAQCQQSSSAVFSAMAQDQRLIEPIRRVYTELRQRLERDGLAPGVGEAVIAAMDGLWLYRVLGLTPVDRAFLDRVRGVFEGLIAGQPGATPAARGASGPRTTARPSPRGRARAAGHPAGGNRGGAA